MTQPARTKPFPDTEPPHLPDVVTRQSPWAFLFAVSALFELVLAWRSWSGQFPIPEPDQVRLLADLLIPSTVFPLLGFVLFVRHPDARRSMPLLVIGLLLLTALTVISEFDPQVYRALVGDSGESINSPILTAYIAIKSVVRFVGLIAIGTGLAAVRTRTPSPVERPVSIALGAVALVAVVVNPFTFSLFAPETPDQLPAALVGTVLTSLTSLAWAYVAATTVGGWRAHELPRRAWATGAIAVSYLFAYRLFAEVSLWFGEAAFGVSQLANIASFAAWLLLPVAFAIGLPTPAPAQTSEGGGPPPHAALDSQS